mmetsp:Transcript_27879/g.39191  ORF Transcript_27879/g.39191 Transcript_27879/m.39191 type:complete len:347 (+) Transcript_27879:205-1245(+)
MATSSAQTANKSSLVTDKERAKWTVKSVDQDASLVPTLGVLVWLGWMGVVPLMITYTIFFATSNQRIFLIGLMTLSLLIPRKFFGKYGTKFGNWMMVQAEKYFALKTTIEDADAIVKTSHDGKASIFAFEPHDVLPFSVFAFNSCLGRIPGRAGETGAALMTSAVFNVPFMKHVYTWVGGDPVDKKTFRKRLERGESFTFCPGGVQEMTLMDPAKPNEVVLYLANRKGFVKLALEKGNPIVPCFCFNLRGAYGYFVPRGELVNKVARAIGFLPLFFWGRFGIPLGIPKPQKMHVVIGKPMDIPCVGANPPPEMIDKYHALFLKELEALFDRHKHDEGYGERTLKIM